MLKTKSTSHVRWLMLPVIALLAVSFISFSFTDSATAAVPTQAGSCQWQIVPSPNTSSLFNNRLEDVVAISATDAWAVGSGDGEILIQRWDGSQWSIFPAPEIPDVSTRTNVIRSRLLSIDAFAADDIWAVGTYIDGPSDRSMPLALHYDGTAWEVVPTPNSLDTFNAPRIPALNGVTVIAPDDVWAVGGEARDFANIQFVDDPGLLLHWDGSVWTPAFPPPNTGFGASMFGVAAADSNSVTAVGPRPPRSYQFDGSQWTEEDSILGNNFIAVAAADGQNVMAVGTQPSQIISSGGSFPESALSRLYNGNRWISGPSSRPARVNTSAGQGFRDVSAFSPNDIWAVGYAGDFTMTQLWDGSQWQLVPSDNGNPNENRNRLDVNRLLGVDVISASNGWAVGYFYADSGSQNTLVLRLDCDGSGDPTPTPTPDPDQNAIFVSSTSGGNVDGVQFRDEDIIVYDGASWSLHFDGSDVGIGGADVDAFTMLADGSLLLSFNNPFTVSGIAADDSDILRFEPTSLGTTTSGTFSLYVDGSDLGLDTNGEDIDSLTVASEDETLTLLIGFVGNAQVAGATVRDEDLIALTLTQSGSNTVGTWALDFDGSDVGLNNGGDEDVWGASLIGGDLYLTTRGAFSVSGASGDQADVLLCGGVTNDPTTCQFSLFQDGGGLGIGNERLDALMIGSAGN
ncbi:MAG: hypothetical protein AAF633_02035 [Chloroflexota bacterium]